MTKFINILQRLAFRSLMLDHKVTSARFIALKRIMTQLLGEFEKIGNGAGMFQRLV